MLVQCSLSSEWSPFPCWHSPQTWETTECICKEQSRLVNVYHQGPAPSATSLPVYPEHCHPPTWMIHPKFNPGLISESLGSLSKMPVPRRHPQGCSCSRSGQGLGGCTSMSRSRILKHIRGFAHALPFQTTCLFPSRRNWVIGVRGQREAKQG